MIEPETIQRVARLLASGQYSQRTIARLAAVSRATVSQVAHGLFNEEIASMTADELETDQVEIQRPYVRCPTCGGRVLLPCLLCQLHAREERDRRRTRLRAWLAPPDGQCEIVDPIAARRQRIDWPSRSEATTVDTTKGFNANSFTARDFTEPGGDCCGQRDDESPCRSPPPERRPPAPGYSARALD